MASAGAEAGGQRQDEYKGPLKGVARDFDRAYGVAVQLTGLTTRANGLTPAKGTAPSCIQLQDSTYDCAPDTVRNPVRILIVR